MANELAEQLDPTQPEEVEEKPVEEKAEAPKEDAPKEEVKVEEKEAPKPEKTVPLAALHEERARRKEIQQQMAAMAERQRVSEERFAQIQEAIRQQNAPKPPSFEEDPISALRFQNEATQSQLSQIREQQQQEQQRQYQAFQRNQYVEQVAQAVNQAETEYKSENADYLEAVRHLKTLRANQLQALGMDEGAVMAYVQNESFQIAEAALQRGQNPAEVAFKMAVASGWQKKADAPKQTTQEQKIETLQKGVKAATSLGSGGTPTGKVTADAIADMDDEEFDSFMKSGGWNKLG